LDIDSELQIINKDCLRRVKITNSKHNADSAIILFISGSITLCLLPFCVIRIMQGDWPIAALNVSITTLSFALFCYVYFTYRTLMARWGLSLLSMIAMLSTIHLKGAEQVLWLYPALTTVFYMLSAHFAAVVGIVCLVAAFIIIYPDVNSLYLLTIAATAAITFVFSYAFSLKMHKKAYFFRNESETDSLTGLGNRRALDGKLAEITKKIKTKSLTSCSLLLLDIDNFKNINDTFGHKCGDQVLEAFANVLLKGIRGKDSAYRFGGEEFVIILTNTPLEGALTLANNLLKDIEMTQWEMLENKVLTSSGGVAELNGTEAFYDWISRADRALYEAKNAGRNRIVADSSNLDNRAVA
jgi:diguanylate cyclase (GGDEF)-like protein